MLYWLRNFVGWTRMAYQSVRNQIALEIKKINDKIEKLEESIAGTDEWVVDIYGLEEKLEDKFECLEEELMAVKAEKHRTEESP